MNYENSNSESGTLQNNLQNHTSSENASENNMNLCSCGCGFVIESLEFIRLHVESQEEQEQ